MDRIKDLPASDIDAETRTAARESISGLADSAVALDDAAKEELIKSASQLARL